MVKNWPVLLGMLSFLIVGSAAVAEAPAKDSQPASTAELSAAPPAGKPDDNVIRLTPDTTRVVRLEQDAVSVLVTNPEHARVLLDSPRMMIVMPRTPGTTPIMALNAKGETILQKTVIVSATAAPKYVRIRRMCGTIGPPECIATSFYYCPDGCYEVNPVNPANDTTTIPPPMGGGPQNNSDNADNGDVQQQDQR